MLRYIMWMKSHCFATDASKVMEHLMLKYRNTWKRFHYTHTHYFKLQRTPLMAFLQVYWGSTRSSFLQVIPLWRHQISPSSRSSHWGGTRSSFLQVIPLWQHQISPSSRSSHCGGTRSVKYTHHPQWLSPLSSSLWECFPRISFLHFFAV